MTSTSPADAPRAPASEHRALAVPTRAAILEVLRKADRPLDAREVAAEVGLHVTTTRGHLDVLVGSGHAVRETEERTSRGRPRVLYAPTALRESSEGDGMLAMILASHLAGTAERPAAAAEQAGRAWGGYLVRRPTPFRRTDVSTAVASTVDLLGQLGFAPRPQRSREGTVVELRHCPFLDVAQAHPDVACAVHLGLLRGALESLDAPVEATALEPFVTPTLCRAHLRHPVPESPEG